MVLSTDIKTILIKYNQPYTIKYMSKKNKKNFGICLDCNYWNNLFNSCEYCIIHFNIVYNIVNTHNNVSNIYINEKKLHTYYLFKYIIKHLNFRCFNKHDELYFNFLSKFRENLSIYHININYKTLFLFFLIFQDKKNIFV
jgi:hypothetical protein